MVHDRDAVAQPLGLLHVVGGQQDRAPARAKARDQIPELPPRLRIQARGRLVEEQQLGLADQRAGQRQPLALAAGELTDPGLGLLPELDQVDHLAGRRAAPIEAPEETDGLGDGELLRELGLLERDPEQGAERAIVAAPPPTQDDHLAGVGGRQAFADLDRGGLARAVGAEQAEALAGADLEVETGHGDDLSIGLAEAA